MEINDAWCEVFVRVDPPNIFNCILINKQCLEVITAPGFRRMYQKRWNPNSPVVGFLTHDTDDTDVLNDFLNVVNVSFRASCKLGRMMNAPLSEDDVKTRFVSKSGTGDLLYGVLPNSLFVMSPTADKNPVKLPEPESWSWQDYAPAILSKHDSYKVILIRQNNFSFEILTFCPSLGKWESSDHKSEHNLYVGPLQDIVNSSRGLVYWPPCVDVIGDSSSLIAVYDDNNEQEPVSWIPGPPDPPSLITLVKPNYSLSPQGHLQCAFQSWWETDHRMIYNWILDDNKVWKKLHCDVSWRGSISSVSFVPGKSDLLFVRTDSGRRYFIYNLNDGKMDEFSCEPDKRITWGADDNMDLSPLMIADLGIWPSSPFSDTTQAQTLNNNIRDVKQLLAAVEQS